MQINFTLNGLWTILQQTLTYLLPFKSEKVYYYWRIQIWGTKKLSRIKSRQ